MSKKENDQEYSQVESHLLQTMYGDQHEEGEIDLLEYWNAIWNKRKFIIGVSFIVAVMVAGITLTMPNIYQAEVLLAPVGHQSVSRGGLSSVLSSLGGLTGRSALGGSTSSVEENIAVLKSREFIWSFVKDEKMMPLLFDRAWDAEKQQWLSENPKDQPSLWDAWRLLIEGGVLSVSMENESGLVKFAITWKDPELATLWVMKLVERINNHLRQEAIESSNKKLEYLKQELSKTTIEENRQALYELISAEQKQAMLANTQQDYVFRVIDPASVPDKKIKPKRSRIIIASSLVAVFLCVIYVLIVDGLRRRKESLERV